MLPQHNHSSNASITFPSFSISKNPHLQFVSMHCGGDKWLLHVWVSAAKVKTWFTIHSLRKQLTSETGFYVTLVTLLSHCKKSTLHSVLLQNLAQMKMPFLEHMLCVKGCTLTQCVIHCKTLKTIRFAKTI